MESEISYATMQRELDEKKAKAEKIIRLHVAGAFVIGFCPIPFSDMPLLLANQTALVNNILNTYEMEGLQELFGTLLCEIGLGAVISHLAIQGTAFISGELLKVLPGVGRIAGCLVDGAMAGVITYAYALAVNTFAYNKCKSNIYGGRDLYVTDEDINNFTHAFRRAFDELSYKSLDSQTLYE